MSRVTRRKNFRPRNDIIWRLALDHRDKCYIDLYSFTVEMRHWMPYLDQRGQQQQPKARDLRRADPGLLYYIRENYLTRLSRKYASDPGEDRYEIAMNTESKERRFKRWFPNCLGDTPTATDLEQLCMTVQLNMCHLGDDRHQNRAHYFEAKRKAKRIRQTVRMLDLTELDTLFQYCDDLLEDLSLLSGGPALASGNMNQASCEETAEDLVDRILLGDAYAVNYFITRDMPRERLYARLHEIHDKGIGDEDDFDDEPLKFFNDAQYTPLFYPDGRIPVWAANPA